MSSVGKKPRVGVEALGNTAEIQPPGGVLVEPKRVRSNDDPGAYRLKADAKKPIPGDPSLATFSSRVLSLLRGHGRSVAIALLGASLPMFMGGSVSARETPPVAFVEPVHVAAPATVVMAELSAVPVGYYSDRHKVLAKSVADQAAAIARGERPAANLGVDAAAVFLFHQAERVRAVKERASGKTLVAVLGSSTSPRSVARWLIAHLQNAPAGSPAALYLASLGTSPDVRIDKLAQSIADKVEKPLGERRLDEGKDALDEELDAARQAGVLFFKAAGDEGRANDKSSELSKDFADGLEAPIVVAAGTLDAKTGELSLLPSSATAWAMLSAPGVDTPHAATWAANLAAKVLAAHPGLTPDQLELLLSDPSALSNDRPGMRDGLGMPDLPKLLVLAAQAKLGRVAFAPDRAHYLVDKAMKGRKPAPADHAYVRHIANIRSALSERGLPTRADGVPVLVYEGSWDDHVGMVVRTLADPVVGVAPGADVSLIMSTPWYDERHRQAAGRSRSGEERVLNGAEPSAALVISKAVATVYYRASGVKDAQRRATGDRTTLVNMSFGTTSATIAERLLDLMEDAPKGSLAHKKLLSLGKTRSQREKATTEWVATILESEAAQAAVRTPVQVLRAELKKARERRVLVFASAGNSFEAWMTRPSHSAHVEGKVDGLLGVGATKIGDPLRYDDDQSSDFSSDGPPNFSAPGQDMPVGPEGDVRGTSFASPYSVGVAALMLKANAELSPDEIEAILLAAEVVHDLPGERDGAGVIDPVSAVALARGKAGAH